MSLVASIARPNQTESAMKCSAMPQMHNAKPNDRTHPWLGPFGMKRGTTKPITSQKTLMPSGTYSFADILRPLT
ncbi:hypothetical protein TYRP_008117 [Tyrophagus putrescentiae]|nr:hypothetical protein TYRP_008117 [Tyrophagus putrescentiae]